MSLGDNVNHHKEEWREFYKIAPTNSYFSVTSLPITPERNISCCDTEHNPDKLIRLTIAQLY